MDGNPIDDILTSTEKALGVTFTPEEREQMKAKYKGNAELAFQDMINSTKKFKNVDFTYKERLDMKSKYKVPLAWVDVMALSENPEMKSDIKNKAGESSAAGYWQVTKDHESDIRKMYGVSHDDFLKDANIQERYVKEKLEPEYDKNLSNFKNIASAGIQEGRYKDFENLMVKGKFTDDQIKALNHVLGSTGAAHFLRTGTFLGTNPERKARDVKRTLGEVINIRKKYGVPSFISDQYDFGDVETTASLPAAEDKVEETPAPKGAMPPGRTVEPIIDWQKGTVTNINPVTKKPEPVKTIKQEKQKGVTKKDIVEVAPGVVQTIDWEKAQTKTEVKDPEKYQEYIEESKAKKQPEAPLSEENSLIYKYFGEEGLGFVSAIKRGLNSGEIADILALGRTPTKEEMRRIAELQKENMQQKPSQAYNDFLNSEGFSESIGIFAQNPFEILTQLATESLVAQLRHGLSRAVAGAGVGAGLGATALGAGALPGAGVGFLAGMSVAGLNLEVSASVLEALQEAGIDVTDPKSLEEGFANEELMTQAREFAYKRGVPIAVFDAISGGIAGKFFAKPAATIAGKVLRGGAEMGTQMGLSAAGETTAQIVSGQELNTTAILAEALGEIGGGLPEIAVGTAIEAKRVGKRTRDLLFGIDLPKKNFEDMVDISEGAGQITQQEADELKAEFDDVQKVKDKVPEDYRSNKVIFDLIEERDRLTQEMGKVDPIFEAEYKQKIEGINQKIQEETIKQKQTTAAPATKKAYDFDGTLFDNKTGKLTSLGEDVKKRIEAGEDVVVVTAREEGNIQEIQDALGIGADKIEATGDEKKKAEALQKRGISVQDYFDADKKKLDAIQGGITESQPAAGITKEQQAELDKVSKRAERIQRTLQEDAEVQEEGDEPLLTAEQKKKLETELQTLNQRKDAIQKQSTAEVPIQSGAQGGPGVGGQVQAGPEVTAGKGKEGETEAKGKAEEETIDSFIAQQATDVEVTLALDDVNSRMNNAEYIEEAELNKRADQLYSIWDKIDSNPNLTEDQKENLKSKVETQIQKLEQYELATAAKVGETTQTRTVKGPRVIGTTTKKSPSKYEVTPERIAETKTTTVTDKNGKQKSGTWEVLPNGSLQVTDAKGNVVPVVDGYSFKETVKDKEGNVISAVLEDKGTGTTFTIDNPDLALDIAIKAKEMELGPIEEGVFESVLQEVKVKAEPILTRESKQAPQAKKAEAPTPTPTTTEKVSQKAAEAPKKANTVQGFELTKKDGTKAAPAEYRKNEKGNWGKVNAKGGVTPVSSPAQVKQLEDALSSQAAAETKKAAPAKTPDALKDVESTAKALSKISNLGNALTKIKTFSIDGLKEFFHASPTKRTGRLKKNNATQFGIAVYFSTNKDLVISEFGDNVTNVALSLTNPVFTNTKQWNEVEKRAIELADEDYGKRKNLTLGEDETFFKYDPEDSSEVAEIPSRFISDAAIELGYDAIVDKQGDFQYENEIAVLDESKIIYEEDLPSFVSESYHKAKKDGSNPALVKAVEGLLGVAPSQPAAEGKAVPTTQQEDVASELAKANNISKTQAKTIAAVINTVKKNIAKRLGISLPEYRRRTAIRVVPKLKNIIKDFPNSLSSFRGLSSELINDFTGATQELKVAFQDAFGKVDAKFIKNNGIDNNDFILSSVLTLDNNGYFDFLGKGKKLSSMKKEAIQEELNKRLSDILDRAKNTNDFYIKEFSNTWLKEAQKRATTELEKEAYQLMIDGNEDALSQQLENIQSQQKANLLASLNYLIPSKDYSPEFKYAVVSMALKGAQAKPITIKGKLIDGKLAKRNDQTVGNHQELSSMVLPNVYAEMQRGSGSHPMELIDKHTDKSIIGRDETWELVKDRVFKKSDGGYWIKFEKSNEDSDIQALTLVSKKVQKVMSADDNPWCTGGGMAATYLPKGNFYLFLNENLDPQITVRYEGDTIAELRGTDKGQTLSESQTNIAEKFLDDIPNGKDYKNQVKASKVYYKLINDIEPTTKQDLQDFLDVYDIDLETYDINKQDKFFQLKNINFDKYISLNDKVKLYDEIVKNTDARDIAVFEDIAKKNPNSPLLKKKVLVIGDLYLRDFRGYVYPEELEIRGNLSFEDQYTSRSITLPNKLRISGKLIFNDINLSQDFKLPKDLQIGGSLIFENIIIPQGFVIPEGIKIGDSLYFNRVKIPQGFTLPNNLKSENGIYFSEMEIPKYFTFPQDLETRRLDITNSNIQEGFTLPNNLKLKDALSFASSILPKDFTLPSGLEAGALYLSETNLPENFTIPKDIKVDRSLSFARSTIRKGLNLPQDFKADGLDFTASVIEEGLSLPKGLDTNSLRFREAIFLSKSDMKKYLDLVEEKNRVVKEEGLTKYLLQGQDKVKKFKREYVQLRVIAENISVENTQFLNISEDSKINYLNFNTTVLPKNFNLPIGLNIDPRSIDFDSSLLESGGEAETIFERWSAEKSIAKQDSRGAIIETPTSTLMLLDKDNADVTTPIHEVAHEYEKVLTADERKVMEKWSGAKFGTTKFREAFAKGAERYLYEGATFNGKVDAVFEKLKNWFKNVITDAINYFGDINQLTPEVREIYSKMLIDGDMDVVETVAPSPTAAEGKDRGETTPTPTPAQTAAETKTAQEAAQTKQEAETESEVLGASTLSKKYQRYIARILATPGFSPEYVDALMNNAPMKSPAKDADVRKLANDFVDNLNTLEDYEEGFTELIKQYAARFEAIANNYEEANKGSWEVYAMRLIHSRVVDNFSPQDAINITLKTANIATTLGQGLRMYGLVDPGLLHILHFSKHSLTEKQLFEQEAAEGSGVTVQQTIDNILEIYDSATAEQKEQLKKRIAKEIKDQAKKETDKEKGPQPPKAETPPNEEAKNSKKDLIQYFDSKAKEYLKSFENRTGKGLTSGLDIDALIDYAMYLYYASAGSVVKAKRAFEKKFGEKTTQENWDTILESQQFEDATLDIAQQKLIFAIDRSGNPDEYTGVKTQNMTPSQMIIQSLSRYLLNKNKKPATKKDFQDIIKQKDLDINTLSQLRLDILGGLLSETPEKRAEILNQVDDLLVALSKDKLDTIAAPWVKKTVIRQSIKENLDNMFLTVDNMIDDLINRRVLTGAVVEEFIQRTGFTKEQAAPYVKIIQENIDEVINKRVEAKINKAIKDAYGIDIVKMEESIKHLTNTIPQMQKTFEDKRKELDSAIRSGATKDEVTRLQQELKSAKEILANNKERLKGLKAKRKQGATKLEKRAKGLAKAPSFEAIADIIKNGGLSDENIKGIFAESIGAKNFTHKDAETLRALYKRLDESLFAVDKKEAQEAIAKFIYSIKSDNDKQLFIEMFDSYAYSNMLGAFKTTDLALTSGYFTFTFLETISGGIQVGKDITNLFIPGRSKDFKNTRLVVDALFNMRNTQFSFKKFADVILGREGIGLPELSMADDKGKKVVTNINSSITYLDKVRMRRDEAIKKGEKTKAFFLNFMIGHNIASRGLLAADYMVTNTLLPYAVYRNVTAQAMQELKDAGLMSPSYADLRKAIERGMGKDQVEQQLQNEGLAPTITTKDGKVIKSEKYKKRKAEILFEFVGNGSNQAMIQSEDQMRRIAFTGRIAGFSGKTVQKINQWFNAISEAGATKEQKNLGAMMAASIARLLTSPFAGATFRFIQSVKNATPFGLLQLNKQNKKGAFDIFFSEYNYYNVYTGEVESVPATVFEKEQRVAMALIPTVVAMSVLSSMFDFDDEEDIKIKDDGWLFTTSYSPAMKTKIETGGGTYEPFAIYEKKGNRYERVMAYKDYAPLWFLAGIGRLQEKILFDQEAAKVGEQVEGQPKDPLTTWEAFGESIRSLMAYATQGNLSSGAGVVGGVAEALEGAGGISYPVIKSVQGLVRQMIPFASLQAEADNYYALLGAAKKEGANKITKTLDDMILFRPLFNNTDFDILGEDVVKGPYGPPITTVTTAAAQGLGNSMNGSRYSKYPGARDLITRHPDISPIRDFKFGAMSSSDYKGTTVEPPSDPQVNYDLLRAAQTEKATIMEERYDKLKDLNKLELEKELEKINRDVNSKVKLDYVRSRLLLMYDEDVVNRLKKPKDINDFMVKEGIILRADGYLGIQDYEEAYFRYDEQKPE